MRQSHAVPVPHFGVILRWPNWEALVQRLRSAQVPFLIEPRIGFVGKAGEQGFLFIRDPNDNVLAFKSFRNIEAQLSAR
jgi:extradiol dioxygenase family protein